MEAEKVRNLSDAELSQAQRDQMDQLFRLKFQMKMGQTESLTKIRSLRRGMARLKTIARERELGIGTAAPAGSAKSAKTPSAKTETKSAAPVKAAAGKTQKKAAKKSAAKTASAKSKAAGKNASKKSGKR